MHTDCWGRQEPDTGGRMSIWNSLVSVVSALTSQFQDVLCAVRHWTIICGFHRSRHMVTQCNANAWALVSGSVLTRSRLGWSSLRAKTLGSRQGFLPRVFAIESCH